LRRVERQGTTRTPTAVLHAFMVGVTIAISLIYRQNATRQMQVEHNKISTVMIHLQRMQRLAEVKMWQQVLKSTCMKFVITAMKEKKLELCNI